MPRVGRIVAIDCPHHVTQRGNRRAPIFLRQGDEQTYLDLLSEQTRRNGVEVWAYCLMPNHVHLVLTPTIDGGLVWAVGETHRRYSHFINSREGWTGHLFQARFASVVMDERHLISAFRYVAMNPVRARLVEQAEDWPWSSVRAHLDRGSDGLVRIDPLLSRIDDFADLLHADDADLPEFAVLRMAESTGRPLGDAAFIDRVTATAKGTA